MESLVEFMGYSTHGRREAGIFFSYKHNLLKLMSWYTNMSFHKMCLGAAVRGIIVA